MTTPTITAFEASPDRGRGLARDMPVRWAFEEAGLAYDVRLVSFAEMKQPAHRALQPFGQIPTYEDGQVAIFESAAIVLHIAGTHPGLMPSDAASRARVLAWTFAAKATIEPPILAREAAHFTERDQAWHAERIPLMDGRIRAGFEQLSAALADGDWLVGAFSAADVVMVNVLRRPITADSLAEFPNLSAYVARAEARPAFQRAFKAQKAVFDASRA